MQQFTVPQFIDVEDKIIGPITTRQFIICLAAAILMVVCFKIFDFSLFVFSSLVIVAVFGVFAFAKINSRPFHLFILNFTQTLKKPGLRVWNHRLKKNISLKEEALPPAPAPAPVMKRWNASRLAELSLIVDTGGSYAGEGGRKRDIKSL